jgi:hypothetical protein
MVEKYVPKVGDKVRATLGENVLVGRVDDIGEKFGNWVSLLPDGIEDVEPYLLSGADGWHFEQFVSVPTKFGAVIRRADGRTFVHAPSRIGDTVPWFANSRHWASTENATAGGFTVLFDGVDE